MICDDFREEFELYALGLAEPETQTAMREHLGSGCERCNRELQRALAMNAQILAAGEFPAPPARIRQRVLDTLSPRKQRQWLAWLAPALAVASLAVAFVYRSELGTARNQLAALRHENESLTATAQRMERVLAVISAEGTQVVPAGVRPQQPKANYFLNSQQGVLLIASHLPLLEPGRTYQMWIIPKGQPPRPAGLFRPDATGAAVHLFEGATAPGTTAALAVSVEPESGSAAPTTTPQLVAPVAGE